MVFLELGFVWNKIGLIFHTRSLRIFAVMMCGLLHWGVGYIQVGIYILGGGKKPKTKLASSLSAEVW